MSEFVASHAFARIPVTDVEAALEWYARFFGRGPDLTPKPGEAVWHAAPTASIFVVFDPRWAGSANVVLAVADLEVWRGELGGRGISTGIEGDGVARKLTTTDPDGNKIDSFADPETERGRMR